MVEEDRGDDGDGGGVGSVAEGALDKSLAEVAHHD